MRWPHAKQTHTAARREEDVSYNIVTVANRVVQRRGHNDRVCVAATSKQTHTFKL